MTTIIPSRRREIKINNAIWVVMDIWVLFFFLFFSFFGGQQKDNNENKKKLKEKKDTPSSFGTKKATQYEEDANAEERERGGKIYTSLERPSVAYISFRFLIFFFASVDQSEHSSVCSRRGRSGVCVYVCGWGRSFCFSF